jgi:primosomal protein N''
LPVVKEQDEKIKTLEQELEKHKGYAKRVEQMEAEMDALRGQFSSLVRKLF